MIDLNRFLRMISDEPQRHWAAYQAWFRYHPNEEVEDELQTVRSSDSGTPRIQEG